MKKSSVRKSIEGLGVLEGLFIAACGVGGFFLAKKVMAAKPPSDEKDDGKSAKPSAPIAPPVPAPAPHANVAVPAIPPLPNQPKVKPAAPSSDGGILDAISKLPADPNNSGSFEDLLNASKS